MAWIAVVLDADAASAGRLADALLEAGALAVSGEAAPGEPEAADGEEGDAPAWARERLTALLDPSRDPAALLGEACLRAGLSPVPSFRTERIADEDWLRRSRDQFGPIRVGQRLWVVPSWCEPPDPSALVLRLDPGLAFGTGSHASTRLALAWLERELRGGERVLDYGCGSGILALAAARLGAGLVHAVDIDPQAIETARENARRNGLAVGVGRPEDFASVRYDVLVANILAGPLVALRAEFAVRTVPGARIALSGILESQAAEVLEAYGGDFSLAVADCDEGWALLAGVRR